MRNMTTSNQVLAVVLIVVLVVALFFGGGLWAQGVLSNNNSLGIGDLNWIQILISIAIGFGLGFLYSRRRRWWQ